LEEEVRMLEDHLEPGWSSTVFHTYWEREDIEGLLDSTKTVLPDQKSFFG
jgi:hypothetical protein